MRSIDLTSIPKRGQFYDWMKSVGCTCHVIFDDVALDFMIIDVYRKNRTTYLKIISNHRSAKGVYDIGAKAFSNNNFFRIIKNSKYDIGEKVNGKLLIEDVFIDNYNDGKLTYKIRCTSCGHIFKRRVDSFEKGKALCSCCDLNRIIKKGVNDVATKRPELVKYFCNKEDAYKYSVSSNVNVKLICPNCKTIKEMKLYDFTTSGISCPTCGDGVSYPNKFMRNLLKECNVPFISEFSPDWANNRKYDFYLTEENVLIEMDGEQHYKNIKHWGGLISTQENDEYKTNMAKEQGIQLIRINCSYENIKDRFDNIKKSVEDSYIFEIIKDSKIDWNSINRLSIESDVIRACKLRSEKNLTLNEISDIIGVHTQTVREWLRLGEKIGLCVYDNTVDQKSAMSKIIRKLNNPVLCIENKTIYESPIACSNELDVAPTTIRANCTYNKSGKGLHFKYLKDLTQEEFTYYNCEQWLKDNDLWDIFVSKNKVV